MNSMAFLDIICLTMLYQVFFNPLEVFCLYIMVSGFVCLWYLCVCAIVCVFLYLCVFYSFGFVSFSCLLACFVLFWCLCILSSFLGTCLYPNERKEEYGLD